MSAPSGYTALDFVGFTDKGTYNSSSTYMRNDLVHYGGNIMRCLIDNTSNVTPVVGANWELWVGASANLAERTIAPLENNPADVAYGVGRQIIYDDWLWEVIAPIAVGDALVDYAVDPTNANIKKSAPVETQLLAVKAEADATDNMIAPTEADASSSSAAYAVGDQLILNNVLYTVTDAITIGDALVSGTGGNIEASDSLTDQLASKADDSALATVAKTGAYSDLSGNPTLGTAAAKNSTNAVTQNSTDLVESGAVYSEVNTVKQALTNEAITRSKVGAHNLLPMKLDFIKDNNITGTWSDNAYSIDNVVVTFYADALGNVQRIHFVITAPTTVFIPILISHKDFGNTEISSYTGGGTPDRANGYIISDGLGTSISSPRLVYKASDNSILFRVDEGTSAVEYDIYPMVRRETDENTIFEPYALPNSEIPFQIVRGTKTISSSGQEVTFGFGNNVYFYDIPTVVVCFNETRQKVLANVGSNNISVVDITRTGFTVHIDRVANTDALKIQYIATTLGVVAN